MNKKLLNAGYWFGGALCTIGLLALVLGLKTLVVGLKNKPAMIRLPGQETVQLKFPGAYVLVFAPFQKMEPGAAETLSELNYMVTEKKTGEVVQLVKMPPPAYASEGHQGVMPLAQFVIDREGGYEFTSAYPIGIEGPSVSAVLYHTDFRYIWIELIVGLLMFVLFNIVGVILIVKTHRSQKPKQALPPLHDHRNRKT
jgi:hypothetical protein